MSIQLTKSASNAVSSALERRGGGIGIRLDVSTRGDSGLSIGLSFADEMRENDLSFVQEGIQILVEMSSLPYLQGILLDYHEDEEKSGFFITHTEPCDVCGCSRAETV